MLLYPNSKVYVICAGGIRSDNAELCHRLCSTLILLGIDTKIVYISVVKNFDPEHPVHPAYKSFQTPYTYEVEDNPKNIFIVPETMNSLLYSVKNIRRVIWWLSVDNYFRDIALKAASKLKNILDEPAPRFFSFHRGDSDVEHWTQSEYAKTFLKLNGIPDEKIYHIGDFVSPALVKLQSKVDFKRKKNRVAFNAATTSANIPKLAGKFPKVDWIAIQDPQAEDAPKLLADAKVYVDFSDHVSKDLMVRRAALLGCVVITNKVGAAANDVDICIPPEFKFDDTEEEFPNIVKKIRAVLDNHKKEYAAQKKFLDEISSEQENFTRNVAMALGVKISSENDPAAIFNGLNETGAAVAEILSRDEVGIEIKYIINDDENNFENPELNVIKLQNQNVLLLSDGQLLPIISSSDARFLYNERRIRKIIMLTDNKDAKNFVKKNIEPADDDIVSTGME